MIPPRRPMGHKPVDLGTAVRRRSGLILPGRFKDQPEVESAAENLAADTTIKKILSAQAMRLGLLNWLTASGCTDARALYMLTSTLAELAMATGVPLQAVIEGLTSWWQHNETQVRANIERQKQQNPPAANQEKAQ